MKKLLCFLMMLGTSLLAEPNVQSFDGFINSLRLINGQPVNLDIDKVQKITGAEFTRQKLSGKMIYKSDYLINEETPEYLFTINRKNGLYYFVLNFTEPASQLMQLLAKEELTREDDTVQANGQRIFNYYGVRDGEGYAQGSQLHIAIYECSDNPEVSCLRKAQIQRTRWTRKTILKH